MRAVRRLADPADAPRWLDAWLARTPLRPGDPASEAVCAIAEAARQGEKAARAAVREARHLNGHQQWQVYSTLATWLGCDLLPVPRDARRLMGAVLAEWCGQHLAAEQPDEDEVIPVRTLNRDELDAADRRRRGRTGTRVYARPACMPDGF